MKFLLNLMIFLPAIGAIVCLAVPTSQRARWVALGTCIITTVMSLILTVGYITGPENQTLLFETKVSWISVINVNYTTGLDGLSLPLVVLTTVLSVLIVIASWKIEKAVRAYMALYLFLLTGMLGVFLALDLFLFYVFFEISLLPMYFLIGIWGGPRKEYAAIKFFLFTLAGSICLLIVMLGLYFITPKAAGSLTNTWDIMAMQEKGGPVAALFAEGGRYWGFAQVAFWLTFIAFAIKIPVAPLHTWLPDAHVEAPTPISMILAGVLLKMGGYALMRITYPFFPDAALLFWQYVAAIGIFSIIYGALCSLAQDDWKKLVAYSSVSHMGYVTLGIAVLTPTAFNGAYFEMIAHGITSALMFFLVGVAYDRAHHRQIDRFGGMWLQWPSYGAWSLIGFFAGMGLPGLCGFIGEIMVLLGTFQAAEQFQDKVGFVYLIGSVAAFGVVLTAAYILWMFNRIYMGKPRPDYGDYEPVSRREKWIMAVLGIAAIAFGIVPWLVFGITADTFAGIMEMLTPSSESVTALFGN